MTLEELETRTGKSILLKKTLWEEFIGIGIEWTERSHCTFGQLPVSMARRRCNLLNCACVMPGVRHAWRTRACQ